MKMEELSAGTLTVKISQTVAQRLEQYDTMFGIRSRVANTFNAHPAVWLRALTTCCGQTSLV